MPPVLMANKTFAPAAKIDGDGRREIKYAFSRPAHRIIAGFAAILGAKTSAAAFSRNMLIILSVNFDCARSKLKGTHYVMQ